MKTIRHSITLAALALTFAGITSSAHAELLTLTQSGIFSGGTTLDGDAFGAPAPFTLQAVFDSTSDTLPGDGLGVFDTVVTFMIADIFTLTSDPSGDLNVELADPDFFNIDEFFLAGVGRANGSADFAGDYITAAPAAFDADMPTPVVLTEPRGRFTSLLPYTIPLANGDGDLVIAEGSTLGPTATITATTASVPEPSPAALFGFGLGLVGVAQLRRRRRLVQPTHNPRNTTQEKLLSGISC